MIKPYDDSLYNIEELVLNKFIDNVYDIKSNFENTQYDLSDKKSYNDLFMYVLNRFNNPTTKLPINGEIIDKKDTQITEDLKLYDTWGIFYRNRSTQAELQDLKIYIDKFDQNIDIRNTSLKAFLDDPSAKPISYSFDEYNELDVDKNTDILFPLEFNQEQIEILDKVEKKGCLN